MQAGSRTMAPPFGTQEEKEFQKRAPDPVLFLAMLAFMIKLAQKLDGRRGIEIEAWTAGCFMFPLTPILELQAVYIVSNHSSRLNAGPTRVFRGGDDVDVVDD